ncbi:MAG TPA: carboxypeptidase regulatory-like domain-containing protein [Longimicrobium sp.]|nr:carboxypeptidase regulatory-like domain-containing protein [Longimicrobium sp.]
MRLRSLLALSLIPLPAVLAAQAGTSAPAVVHGHVTDAVSGGPVPGALVELRDLGLRAFADSAGDFTFQRVPPGTHQWVISRIGYTRWDESTEVEDGDEFSIALLARPEVLQGITAVASQLSQRRATSGVAVQTIERTTLRMTAAPSAYELVHDHLDVAPVPCPTAQLAPRQNSQGAGGGGNGQNGGEPNRNAGNRTRVGTGPSNGDGGDLSCAYVRGNLRRPVVYIDEQRANGGLMDLLNLRPADLYIVESYSGGSMIRVITDQYAERVARGRADILPLRFGP